MKSLSSISNIDKLTNINKLSNIDKLTKSPFPQPPQLKLNYSDYSTKKSYEQPSYFPPIEVKENRSLIDRLFDALSVGNYTIAGGVKSEMEGGNFFQGVWEGLKASNPFGEGYNKGEVTWSDVLEEGGWEADSLGGKIARGGVGFLLDVFLDPLTYVTFGGAGLLKGTGKAALKATHSNVIRKVADEFGADISEGMTEEAAKKIILKQAFKGGYDIADDVLIGEAQKLVKRYNKVMGIQEKASDVTIGLKNMPFGEKLFPNSQVVTLMSGEKLQKLGNSIHLAPAYSILRDKIYGSVIGKHFSTITPLYNLSKTDPGAFYDFVRQVDEVNGLNADRITKNRQIRDIAKGLVDLTPSENKQLIELLEDASKWHYVTDAIKFVDTKIGQRKRAELAAKAESMKRKVTFLSKQRDSIRNLKEYNVGKADEYKAELEKLEKEYHQELLKIDIKDLDEAATRNEYIKLLQEETEKLNAKKEEIVSKVPNTPVDEKTPIYESNIKERQERVATLKNEAKNITNEIKKLHKEQNKVIKSMNKEKEEIVTTFDEKKNAEIKKLFDRLEEIKEEAKQLKKEDYTIFHKPFVDEWEQINNKTKEFAGKRGQYDKLEVVQDDTLDVADEYIVKVKDVSNQKYLDHKMNKIEYIQKLSTYLTGNKNAISFTTYDNNIDVIIDMMKKGSSNEDILEFIAENNKYFDGTYPKIYEWVAEQLGYKSWKVRYWDEKKELTDKIKNNEFVQSNIRKLQELEALRSKREYLVGKLAECKNVDELMIKLTEYENMLLLSNRNDFLFKDMRAKSIEKAVVKLDPNRITDLPPQKILDNLREEYAVDVKDMIKNARAEARANGATKYQLDKISKEIKKKYGTGKVYKTDEELIEIYNAKRGKLKSPEFKEERYPTVLQGIVDAENLKKSKEVYDNKVSKIDRDEIVGNAIKYMEMNADAIELGKLRKEQYLYRLVEEAVELAETFKWQDVYGDGALKHWSTLTDGQKNLLIEIANNNVGKGYSTKQANIKKIRDAARKKISVDKEIEKVGHITESLNVGNDVEIKLPQFDELINVTVTDYRMYDRNALLFEYKGINKADGSEVTFHPDNVVNILKLNSPNSIEGLVRQSGITKRAVQRLDELREEYARVKNEIVTIDKEIADELKSELTNVEHKIGKVETEYELTEEFLEENKKPILDEIKELQRQNKNERAKIARLKKKQELVEEAEAKLIAKEVEELEKQVLEKQKKMMALQKNNEYYSNMKKRQNKSLTEAFEKRAASIRENIEKYEKQAFEYNEKLKRADFDKLDDDILRLEKMEKALESDEFFESYMRSVMGDKAVDKIKLKDKFDVIEIALNDDVDLDDRLRAIANFIRSEMVKWGREEVQIGKLKRGQLYANIKRYLPHDMTDEGKRIFSKDKVKKNIPGFGQKFGYGREFNQYGKSRTFVIKTGEDTYNMKPTILEANEYFDEKVFNDVLSEIYLARGLKHNDLMYDDAYMRTMLDKFGEHIDYNHSAKTGNKIVMNFGMAKDGLKEMAKVWVKMEISESVSEYLGRKDVRELIQDRVNGRMGKMTFYDSAQKAFTRKKITNEEMSNLSIKFIKENYTLEKRTEMFQNHLKQCIDETFMRESLDDIATPMLELSDEQISALERIQRITQNRYLKTVKKQYINLYSQITFEKTGRKVLDIDKKILSRKMDGLTPSELIDFMRNNGFIDSKYQFKFDEIDLLRINRLLEKPKLVDREFMQIRQVNEAIIEKANRMRKVQIIKDNSNMLQLWDKVTHLIKLNQTTVMPSFHMRNKYSNMFNNWLVIGLDAINPKLQKASAQTMYYMRRNEPEKLKDLMINIGGEEKSWEDLYYLATQYNVVDEGFFGQDLGDGFTRGLLGNLLSPKLDPTDAKNFVWYKKGAEIGSQIEGQDRLLHFVSCLKNGMSPEDAADSVRRALFDYSDLTAFEKTTMKRILPYYTWLRKNAALQLEMMLENPKKYMNVSKVINGVEGMVDEDDEINKAFVNEFAKDWVQTPFTVKNPEGREEVVLWNPNLPFMDLGRIPDPTNISGSLKELFSQSNPLFKVPIEQAKNYNYFFEAPIVKEGDSQTNRLEHVLNNFALYGVGSGAVQKQGLDKALHGLNATTGLKFLSYDYDAYKMMKLNELAKEQGTKVNYSDYEKKEKKTYKKSSNKDDKPNALVKGFSDAVSWASNVISDKVYESRPTKASEYTGALRPISQAKYEKLSEEEKKMYMPPTNDEAMAFNKKAVQLEQEAMSKTGKVKKYIWTLMEKNNIGRRNKEYVFGEVVKVNDGDTFEIKVGDEIKSVRMLLVDTPETVKEDVIEQPVGKKASDYTKLHLLGKDTKIIFDGTYEDKYDRTLGYVEIDGIDYNKQLLDEGLAKVGYIYEPSYDRLGEYKKAEKKAYNSKKGIWSIPQYAEPGGEGYFHTVYDEALVRKLNRIADGK